MFKGYDKTSIKIAIQMALPAIVESFFVSFAGLVDSYMVSSLGSEYVAAVGITTQPKFIGLAIFLALSVSVSALTARRLGEKKRDGANSILLTALIAIISLAVVISAVSVIFASPIISFCGSTVETHDIAVEYFRIIMGGMIFNCLQIGINAAQRGSGNTKITMRTNVTSNIVNIIFNYLLIEGHFGFPALGIQGAAIATVLGTVVSCIMSIVSLFNADGFVSIPYIINTKIKPSLSALKSLVSVGYSMFLEQILLRIGFLSTAIMAAAQGADAMAAHQVANNLMGLTFAFGDGMQAAAVALIGRSLGEGNPDKAKRFGNLFQKFGFIVAICIALTYILGARGLMNMFFTEKNIVAIGITLMQIIAFITFFQLRQVIFNGCLRAAGDTRFIAVCSCLSVAIIRPAVSYIAAYQIGMGIYGVWLGTVIDQIVRSILTTWRFKQGKWVNIKI